MNRNKLLVFAIIGIIAVLGVSISLYYNEVPKPLHGVSIIAVGDTIGYNIDVQNLTHLPTLINGTDIFIFNLEGVLVNSTESCVKLSGQSLLTSDSTFVEYLNLAPVTIANMANNHVLDCGPEGIEATKSALRENNVLSVGAGQNIDEACKPLFVEINEWKLAFISYNFKESGAVSATDIKAGAATLKNCNLDFDKLRSETHLIVASMHLGGPNDPDVNGMQVGVVEDLFNLGVDVVIGHSPHVPQAIMEKDGRIAFFSIGNFIFRPDYEMIPLAHTSIIPKIDFYSDRWEVTIIPIILDDDGIPKLSQDDKIISRIVVESSQFDTKIEMHDNLGHITISSLLAILTAKP